MAGEAPTLEAIAKPDTRPASTAAQVVFITRKWAPAMGGMETYCQRLTDELAAREAVDVIALPGRADGMPPTALALLRFPFTVLSRLLSRGAPARIVHLGDMAIWPLGLLARMLTKDAILVLSAHGTDVAFQRRGGILGSAYGLYLKLGARLLPHARVIANSHATSEVLAESGWHNAHVVPLATDCPAEATPSPGNGRVLFAGRLVERKGCGWFIREVLPLLPQEIQLDVAGTGWDEAERAALDDPRVTFLGQLAPAELRSAYAAASCVVVPNIEVASGEYEGFGLVAAEAAAAGAMVLAADHGGLRDAVIDGETGHLLPTGNGPAWAEAIQRVLAMPTSERIALLQRSASHARKHYSWRRVADDTRALYDAEACD